MPPKDPIYTWSKQTKSENFETIECPEYDPYNDFKRDPSGHYLLINVNFATYRLEAGICDKDHTLLKVFSGRKSQDVYEAILQHEKQNSLNWFESKEHIAYLGKELKKAEIALVTGNNAYFQE